MPRSMSEASGNVEVALQAATASLQRRPAFSAVGGKRGARAEGALRTCLAAEHAGEEAWLAGFVGGGAGRGGVGGRRRDPHPRRGGLLGPARGHLAEGGEDALGREGLGEDFGA